MTRLPDRPQLDWKPDGTPVSTGFDDVYFSLSDGLEETRNVFLKACQLPERWKEARNFTIAELGFGTGLNFLATIDCWLASERHPNGWLHFVTVEKFLMTAEQAKAVLYRWPDLQPLADTLLKNWPVRTAGLQHISFPDWQITLSIYIGDAEAALSDMQFSANAWFLDGFAPAKNEGMWSEAIYARMAQLSASGCLVGTYTVAGAVRRGLAATGFQVQKLPGFGRKRERLEAIWECATQFERPDPFLWNYPETDFENVVIIGAGIAGASLALSFARRGYDVNVLDAAAGPANGASGNPLALVMPRLDAADTPQARFLIQSYLYALKTYGIYANEAAKQVDVCQSPLKESETQRFQKLLADPPLDEDWLTETVSTDGAHSLLHKQSALIEPHKLVSAILETSGANMFWNEKIESLPDIRARFGEKALIILANGMNVTALLPDMQLPLAGKFGQVDWAEVQASNAEARASGSYALRADNKLLFGATFEDWAGGTIETSEQARTENLDALERLAPDWKEYISESELQSRAGVRATSPDRMPIAGAAFHLAEITPALQPITKGARITEPLKTIGNIYVLTALGARGFTFAPLLAETITAMATGSPLPVAMAELEHLSPVRFAIRAARRGF